MRTTIGKLATAAALGLAASLTFNCSSEDSDSSSSGGAKDSSSSAVIAGGVSSSSTTVAVQSSSSGANSSSSRTSSSSIACSSSRASSSSAASSSSRAAVVSGGSFTDPRDGQTYEYVPIDSQTWMSENLNYSASGSKCYDNQDSYCTQYGRLYDWNAAMSACPSGWHLPTYDEWNTLSSYVRNASGCSSCDARLLKATDGWYNSGNGQDTYGFAALPGGYGYTEGGFGYAGYYGRWWSASEGYGSYAYRRGMSYDNESTSWNYDGKSEYFSIRCLQD